MAREMNFEKLAAHPHFGQQRAPPHQLTHVWSSQHGQKHCKQPEEPQPGDSPSPASDGEWREPDPGMQEGKQKVNHGACGSSQAWLQQNQVRGVQKDGRQYGSHMPVGYPHPALL